MHALVRGGQILNSGVLPDVWWDEDQGRWWDFTDPANVAAAGWQPVMVEDQPSDTPGKVWETDLSLQAGAPVLTWVERDMTPEELATQAEQAVQFQLADDTAADLAKLEQAITDLQTLLGDNTVEGSIRRWRTSVTNTYSVGDLRALADLLITGDRATRRIARQTLRLAKAMAGDYTSADVGPEDA